ncbi:MAG: hypothetical protein JHD02_00845 [Thermoleophilaceae bacterium]|nr:hypothetical protein [Thermoleophilaceae bacterium]
MNNSESAYQKARVLILVAAFLSFAFSVSLFFLSDEMQGIFVGLWVPSILSLGTFIAPARRQS